MRLGTDLFAADAVAMRDLQNAFYNEHRYDGDAFLRHRENFFDNRNITAIVLEVPNHLIGKGTVHAWATVSLYGHAPEMQVSRWGLPMITHLFLNDPGNQEVKETFNKSVPSDDIALFSGYIADYTQKMTTYAGSVMNPEEYGRQMVSRLCPNTLPYELGTAAAFDLARFNGRPLGDDVQDVMLTLASNRPLEDGAAPDRNRIRTEFPYFGEPYSKEEQKDVVPLLAPVGWDEVVSRHLLLLHLSLKWTTTMNTSFAEKVALITGGTSGIGRATAVAFAEQGANVVISGRREAEGAESLSLIQKAGGQGLFVRGDVSEESEIEALVAKTLERFGQLDFAFNNAGVGGEGRATMTATSDIYNRIMDINVRGVFFSMKHQIPAILQSGGGAIVNNASVLALRPDANSPIYSASKAAVVALTKSAALQFAPKGLRINAICAAIIETDLTKQIRGDEQSRALLMSRHPVGRFGRSEEVAAAVLYLCSPEASFITGVALPLDGGFAL